jgi:serine phosphatase RsbU (regulator of sigma subunit)
VEANRHRNGEAGIRLEHETLLEAVRTIVATLDLETALERLLYLANKSLGFRYCTILLIGENRTSLEVAARYGYPLSMMQRVELAVGKGVTGRVAETGEALIIPDVRLEDRYLEGLKDARSELVVPLVFRGRVLGVVDVQSPELDAFTESDREFLYALAGIASVAIINARNHARAIRSREEEAKRRELERELDLGRTIQKRLLPDRDPHVPGYEIAGVNLPTQTISGDYFDYVELPHGHLGIAVADVSGKGVPAALLAASLQGTIRSHVENIYSIGAVIERANNSLARSTEPEHFATLFYAVLDPRGFLTYVNAGHNPPFLFRADGRVEELTEGGTVLGTFPDLTFSEGWTSIGPGDYLVAYTDGLTDSERGEEPFGEERVVETIERARGAPARVMATVLVTEADAFKGPGPAIDDMTVVVVRRVEAHETERARRP